MKTRGFGLWTWIFVSSASLLAAGNAGATRPLIQSPSALKNVRMALPIDFENALHRDVNGLDQEEAYTRDALMSQAQEYISLRHGDLDKKVALAWYAKCAAQGAVAKNSPNPFCNYELERKINAIAKVLVGSRHDRRGQLAKELVAGDYSHIAQYDRPEVLGATNQLALTGKLDDVAKTMLSTKDCKVPSMATWAAAYKLEERFPAPEAVELVGQLYQKSVDCGADLAAGQSAFRLGLIRVWQEKCEEIPALMGKVETTPAAQQFHARAQYWRFYCAQETGDNEAETSARAALFKDHPMSFQTLAAGGDDDHAMAQVLASKPAQLSLRSIIRPDLNLMIRGSEALIKKGETRLAAEFLDRNTREIGTVEPEVRLYLATLLHRIDATLPKFRILADLFQDSPKSVNEQTLRLFFPLSYYDLVRKKGGAVDPLLILSLIRQESAFNKEARSVVGARGLMQVMPRTARMVSSVKSPQKLLDPATNIGVGTKYFQKKLEQYGGDVELTLAAYNAGFSRVDEWKRRYPTDNKLLFLDLIPFRETRDYVAAILRNYYWYVKLYSISSESLVAGTVGTRTSPTGPVSAKSRDEKVLAIMSANAGAAAMANAILPSKLVTNANLSPLGPNAVGATPLAPNSSSLEAR